MSATAVFLFAGCSKSTDSTTTGTTTAPSSATSPSTTAATRTSGSSSGSTTVGSSASAAGSIKVASTSLGSILVDDKGLTLYVFDKDTGTTSSCSGGCATAWPPATTTGTPTAGSGVDASKLGTTTRDDGTIQITYGGHPLYHYADDSAAGQTNGQGVANSWWVIDASGTKITKKA